MYLSRYLRIHSFKSSNKKVSKNIVVGKFSQVDDDDELMVLFELKLRVCINL